MDNPDPLSIYPDRIFDQMLPSRLSYEMALCIKQWRGSEGFVKQDTAQFLLLIEEMWRRIALREITDRELYAQYHYTLSILLGGVWMHKLLDEHHNKTISFLAWIACSDDFRNTIRATLEKYADWKDTQGDFSLNMAMVMISHSLGNFLRLLPRD